MTPDIDAFPPVGQYTYTDLALASTPDNGSTWIYRGVMHGLSLPSFPFVAPTACNRTDNIAANCRIAVMYYKALPTPTATACVQVCKQDNGTCGGIVFKESAAGGGSAPCGAVGQTCCYLIPSASLGGEGEVATDPLARGHWVHCTIHWM